LGGGGAERVMVTLANGFAQRGHRVDLVLAKAEGPYRSEVSARVNVIDLNRSRVLASLLPLALYLRRERPEAMLSALNHANIVAILARKLGGVSTRLVVSERNSLTSLRADRKGRFILGLMQRLYSDAEHVVAVSQASAAELVEQLRLPERQVTHIPNPVDVEGIRRLSEKRPRHKWLEPGSPPVILAVGRLEPQKDYHTLLDAFARLCADRDVRLVILGEGRMRTELEQRISSLNLQDSVELVGFQSNPFGWMAACDVYVMSSRFEGFPNSLAQAMACGARVVSTDCPTGPYEILEGGKWGRLVQMGDAAALAEALAASLDECNSPDSYKRVDNFRADLIESKYEKILLEINLDFYSKNRR